MPKTKSTTYFLCQQCGNTQPKWMGKCPDCGAWNSLVEFAEKRPSPVAVHSRMAGVPLSTPQRLADITSDAIERLELPMQEFSRVLGGGLVKGSLVLVGGDPGIGKCLTADSRILDPDTGDYLPITAWGARPRRVLSVDEATLRLGPAAVSAFLPQGRRPVVKVATRLGRELRCTASHPVLTARGWRPVGELRPGERVAAPRALPVFGRERMSEAEIRMIANVLAVGRDGRAAGQAVPAGIFRLPREQLALFLDILFAGEGSVFVNRQGLPALAYATASRRLAEDIQHLLLRFGVVTRLCARWRAGNRREPAAYELQGVGVMHAEESISVMGGPRRAVAVGTLAGPAAVAAPVLETLGQGDVYWDEIVAIEPDGEAEVYDLTVPGRANFVANDLIVHNSTLLLQVAAQLAEAAGPVLYVSGEESVRQIKMRADRMDLGSPDGAQRRAEQLYLVTETNLTTILEHVEKINPQLMVVDSIQTIYLDELTSTAGSITQVRECASRLQMLAKGSGVAVFLVGHVTKEGAIAGPKVLEHIVDTVLYLEGDRYHTYRLLRGVKNRFGPTSEVGVFEMRGSGMVEVANPSEAFLAERLVNAPGSAIAVTVEGTRPILVEVQALATPTSFPNPRRTPNGIDFNRLLLITAVLGKRAGLRLAEQDVFVNVIGGLMVEEPAADLAVAVAIASSSRDRPVVADLAFIGELGLNGELRAVGQIGARLREAAKLGFRRCVIPRTIRPPAEGYPSGIEVIPVRTIGEALQVALIGKEPAHAQGGPRRADAEAS